METTIKDIFKRGLGDAKVRSLAWSNDDLTIDLSLPSNGTTARSLCLRFANTARLRVEMDYGDYIGQPLLFSAEAQEKPSGGWVVTLEFGAAPEGVLSFECNHIYEVKQ